MGLHSLKLFSKKAMRVGSATSLSSAGFEASCSIDDESLKKIRSYGKFFSTRFVQVIVQSRTNDKFDLTCSTVSSADWFNVRVDELGEVSAQLRKSTTKYPPDIPSISVDFFLYTKDAETLPLESWSFGFDGSKKTTEESSSLYHDLSTLLRSCMLAARMTPTHRYYVKKQGPDTFVILYRITEGASSLDLGSEMKTIRLGSFATQIGNFSLELNYRTRMEIEQKITSDSPVSDSYHQIVSTTSTTDVQPAFGGSPDTPSSFCEVISHFSTSPASVAASPIPGLLATSPMHGPPLHFITRTRSRTQSTQSANSVNAESPPSSDVSSLEKDGPRRSREHSGSLTISKDIPFAGLLSMSFTGALFPLTALTEEKLTSEKDEDDDDDDDDDDDEKAERKTIQHDPSLESTIVADTALTQAPASCVASVIASTVKNSQTEDDNDEEGEESKEAETSKDSKSDELEEKDDDSFVKIPFFGAGSSPTSMTSNAELGELISACRLAPNITEFENIGDSIERIKKEIGRFETTQGFFDEFVNKVKDQSEKFH